MVDQQSLSAERVHRPGDDWLSWAIPLILALLFAIAAAALVVVELGQPAPQPGFRGIALSNAVSSSGARAGVALFRRHLAWLPYPASGLRLSPTAYVWGLRAAIVAMALIQGMALLAVVRRPGGAWRWLFGPALATVVLLAFPPISTDIYAYASFGWVANRGVNPYLVAPNKLKHDPFAHMNDWTRITSPYGPIWTDLSRAVTSLGGEHAFAAGIGFKLLGGVAALGLGALMLLGARRLTTHRWQAPAALVIVAWSPILLMESVGLAHNDAPMMFLAVAGLLLATSSRRGATRCGLVLIAAAALIKPVALPLLGLAALVRVARGTSGFAAVLRDWALDLLAIAALTAVAFAPYWAGGKLPSTLWDLQKKLYLEHPLHANPLWVWAIPKAANRFGGQAGTAFVKAHADSAARNLTILFIVISLVIVLWPARPTTDSDPSAWLLRRQAWGWAAAGGAMGLIPLNAQAWYAIWVLAPIGLIWVMTVRSRRGLWIVPVMSLLLVGFLVYHTWPFSNSATALRATEPVSGIGRVLREVPH